MKKVSFNFYAVTVNSMKIVFGLVVKKLKRPEQHQHKVDWMDFSRFYHQRQVQTTNENPMLKKNRQVKKQKLVAKALDVDQNKLTLIFIYIKLKLH